MMNRQDIQFKLLQKFSELCEKANVKYALHGHAAFLAYRNQEFEAMKSFNVLMCQGDAEKIADMLDDDDFYFEDFRSNPKFDKHYMMFGYKNSLDFKYTDLNFTKERYIDNHCIRLNIFFVERIARDGKLKPIKIRRKLWQVRYAHVSSDIPKLYYAKRAANAYYKIKGNNRSAKSRYNHKKKIYSIWTWDDIKNYELVRFVGIRSIDSAVFNDLEKKELDGVPVYIFKDFDSYAYRCYGKKWTEKQWKFKSLPLSSELIGWDEYYSDPGVKNAFEEIQKQHEILYLETGRNEEYTKVINNLKKNVIQSGRVVRLRDEYIERKDELFELYESGDMTAFEKEIKPLIQAMQHGIRLGYTFSVDDDIDYLLDSYLRKVEREELADRIKEYRVDV